MVLVTTGYLIVGLLVVGSGVRLDGGKEVGSVIVELVVVGMAV